jgi:hypothetical protein
MKRFTHNDAEHQFCQWNIILEHPAHKRIVDRPEPSQSLKVFLMMPFTLLCFGFPQLPSPPVSIVYFIIEQSFYQPSFNRIS